jgi:imidazole glycerol-phosphate synthase subunit HisF
MTSISALKKRIIPKLLIRNKMYGKQIRPILVVTRNFKEVFEVGDPVSQAMIYEAQLADELFVLNVDRLPISQDLHLLNIIEKLASETFMPLAVGGGVSSLDDFALVLEKGADKVSINTAAVLDLGLISSAAQRFGSQCVVVSIDHRYDISQKKDIVFTHRASSDAGLDVVSWAKKAVDAGAGEIFLTDADRDGSGNGLNLDLGKAVAEAVDVPVISSGGCGAAQHFIEGFGVGKAEGVAAGTFFCFRDQSPMETRAHVRNAGIPVRNET